MSVRQSLWGELKNSAGFNARLDREWEEIWRQAETKGKSERLIYSPALDAMVNAYANDRHLGPYDTIGEARCAAEVQTAPSLSNARNGGLFDPPAIPGRILDARKVVGGHQGAYLEQRALSDAAHDAMAALDRIPAQWGTFR